MPSSEPDPRPRAHLRPGLRVVARGREHLQVGLHPDRRVLLPRTPAVERTLTLLLERRTVVEDPECHAVLDRLDQHGCLSWERARPAERGAVTVLGRLAVPGLPDVTDLLVASGVPLTPHLLDAAVVVVVSAGEIDRDRLDPLVRARTSHVVVRLVDGGAVLGPFVVPGETACLRCVDVHESVHDPDHVAVTTRYARATGLARADGVPDLDPATASMGLAWAVRDVVAHLDGRQPSTWSRTLRLGLEPPFCTDASWSRHPWCGCGWADPPSHQAQLGP